MGATRAHIFLGALTLAAATSAVACNKVDAPTNDPNTTIVQPYGAPMPMNDASVAPVPTTTPDAGPLRPPSPSGAYGAPPKPG